MEPFALIWVPADSSLLMSPLSWLRSNPDRKTTFHSTSLVAFSPSVSEWSVTLTAYGNSDRNFSAATSK